MINQVEDFTATLRDALDEVERAGLVSAAQIARSQCFAACSTSSEWLGEVGVAVTELLAAYGPQLPESTQTKFNICLREVVKVWPKFRPARR